MSSPIPRPRTLTAPTPPKRGLASTLPPPTRSLPIPTSNFPAIPRLSLQSRPPHNPPSKSTSLLRRISPAHSDQTHISNPHTAYLPPPPLRRRRHYSELATRCVINPFLPSVPSPFHPHPPPALRPDRRHFDDAFRRLKIYPTSPGPHVLLYWTPWPPPSLIPQRRRGAQRANQLEIRITGVLSSTARIHDLAGMSSRRLPPPPRRPYALKAKPSSPHSLSTLRHAAAIAPLIDAVDPIIVRDINQI
ncbi:hypothetical protein R3P38DRAFT_3179919 [Favolaschia claudopus]|uniref:Uncharacterized protein n=1 Tax=Favolaschia claudopus TaxID=2862362 RepID=A0AAW0CR56_9AGAR